MKYFYTGIFLGLASLMITPATYAQTVTVAKSGTPDHATIQAAVDSFIGDLNPAPNVIQITDSALYSEVLTVNIPVTIEGTAVSTPIIAAQANALGRAGSAGVVVSLPAPTTTGTVTLRNLTIIPDITSTPQSCAINVINNNVFLSLDKVIISGNDGTNLPVSDNGLSSIAALPAHVNFGDDGIVAGGYDNGEFEGEGFELLLTNTVITHLRGVASGTSDGVLVNTTNTLNRITRLGDGNVISAMNGKGLDVYGDFDSAAPTKRNLIAINSSFGIWFHESLNFRNVRDVVLASNQIGIYESITTASVNATIEDCVFGNQGRQHIRVSGANDNPLNIRRTTFANQTGSTYESIRIDSAAFDVYLADTIIAGNGNSNNINTLNNLGSGEVFLSNTALVNAGPRSLDIPIANPLKQVGAVETFADPNFDNMTDFTLPTFYDVSSVSYANLGSGGTPLAGGAHYTGPAAPAPPVDTIITVSKTGPAGFTTVQGALDSLAEDPTKKYIIQILDGSVYDEMMTMDVPATLIGTGATRPVLAVKANAAGFDNDGTSDTAENAWFGDAGFLIDIPVATTTCTVGLKNLIIIPSTTGGAVVAGVVNKANNFYLEMENLLVTGNNGSDAPVSVDGLSLVPADGAHIHFKTSGAHLGSITNGRPEGDGVEVRIRNCNFTNIRATQGGSWRSGLYMYRSYYATAIPPGLGTPTRPTAFRMLWVDGTSKFTYNLGAGLRTAASLILNAPTTPVYIVGNSYAGLWLDMQKGYNYVTGVVIAESGSFSSGFAGMNEAVSATGPRVVLVDSIIANNAGYGSYNRFGTNTQVPTRFINSTVVNSGITYANQALFSSGGTSINIDIIDSIFAGDGTADSTNNIGLTATAASVFKIISSAIVEDGPRKFSIPSIVPSPTLNTVSGTPVTTADPVFENMMDPFQPNFYAVTNPAYATLASDGSPLSGGGIYVSNSGVTDWSVY